MPRKLKVPSPVALSDLPSDELAKAMAQDRKVEKTLREARNRRPVPMMTEKSIRNGEKFMEKMNRTAQATLLSRIERKELITQDELILRLGGNRRWVKDALKAGRLFSLQGPSGQ